MSIVAELRFHENHRSERQAASAPTCAIRLYLKTPKATRRRIATRRELPTEPPLVSEFMSLLSSLGGYTNRAGDRLRGIGGMGHLELL